MMLAFAVIARRAKRISPAGTAQHRENHRRRGVGGSLHKPRGGLGKTGTRTALRFGAGVALRGGLLLRSRAFRATYREEKRSDTYPKPATDSFLHPYGFAFGRLGAIPVKRRLTPQDFQREKRKV